MKLIFYEFADSAIMNEPMEPAGQSPLGGVKEFGPEEPGEVQPWLLIILGAVILVAVVYFGWYFMGQNKTISAPVVTTSVLPVVQSIEPTADISSSVLPSTSASPISTADWKTYTDAIIGFSFKYPANEYVKKVADNELCIDENLPTAEQTTFCQDASGLNIDVVLNSKNLNLMDFVKNDKANTGETYKYDQVTINGTTGIKSVQTSVCDGVGCDNGTYYLQKDDKVISIRYSDPTDKVFSTVLSTFQFIK